MNASEAPTVTLSRDDVGDETARLRATIHDLRQDIQEHQAARSACSRFIAQAIVALDRGNRDDARQLLHSAGEIAGDF